MEPVYYLITVISVVGTAFNMRMKREGFLFWMVSNILFAIRGYTLGAWDMVLLFLVQFLMAIYGYKFYTHVQSNSGVYEKKTEVIK